MSKHTFLAAALICATGMVATAHSSSIGSDYLNGELTLSRLADGECGSRVPLPTARPDTAKSAAPIATQESASQEWEFIEMPGATPGEKRRVRLVGSRFLPDRAEKIDFYVHSASQGSIINAAFHRAVAYIGLAKPGEQPVAQDDGEQQAGLVQEARLTIDSLELRN